MPISNRFVKSLDDVLAISRAKSWCSSFLGGVARRCSAPVVGACLFVLFEHVVLQLHHPLAVFSSRGPACCGSGCAGRFHRAGSREGASMIETGAAKLRASNPSRFEGHRCVDLDLRQRNPCPDRPTVRKSQLIKLVCPASSQPIAARSVLNGRESAISIRSPAPSLGLNPHIPGCPRLIPGILARGRCHVRGPGAPAPLVFGFFPQVSHAKGPDR